MIAAPFAGDQTLLASDQGSRCILFVMNDLFWLAHESGRINLDEFQWQRRSGHSDEQAVSHSIAALRRSLPEVDLLAKRIAEDLATFDWRLSSALSPTEAQYSVQASYRGSSGYKELRRNALEHLRDKGSRRVSADAIQILELLGYEEDEGSAL
jgi:hypothetical protein